MKCLVCGTEFEGTAKCPVCGFESFGAVGEIPDAIKAIIREKIASEKAKHLGGFKISLIGYRWEEKDGELVEKARENFLIGDNLDKIEVDTVKWGTTEFATQTAGEKKQVAILISDGTNEKQYDVTIVAPNTDTTWKAGVVLKPGFKIAIRIGNENTYSDSEIIALKG